MSEKETDMRKVMMLPALALVPVLLMGCSSSPIDKALKQEAKIHERLQEREVELAKLRIRAGEEQLDSLPAWVLSKPRPDGSGMYGVGIGESPDLTNAIRKSNLQARYDVAKEVNMELSAEDTMVGSSDSQYRYIINSFIDRVNLAGVDDISREIQAGPRGYRVYTLVKLPYREFNRALDAFGPSNELDEAYERLMDRVAGQPAYDPESVTGEKTTAARATPSRDATAL
jgi:hypothetical protein